MGTHAEDSLKSDDIISAEKLLDKKSNKQKKNIKSESKAKTKKIVEEPIITPQIETPVNLLPPKPEEPESLFGSIINIPKSPTKQEFIENIKSQTPPKLKYISTIQLWPNKDNDNYFAKTKDCLGGSSIGTIMNKKTSPQSFQRNIIYGINKTKAIKEGNLGHATLEDITMAQKKYRLLDSTLLRKGTDNKKTFKSDYNKQVLSEFMTQCELENVVGFAYKKDYDNVIASIGLVASDPRWIGIQIGGEKEIPHIWEGFHGCKNRGKADFKNARRKLIVDLKSMMAIDPLTVIKLIVERGIHGQLASYMHGFGKLDGITYENALLICVNYETRTKEFYSLPKTRSDAEANYYERTGRTLYPEWNYSIEAGYDLYEAACKRWVEWNSKYGNVWETIIGENGKIKPKNPWPGYGYETERWHQNESGLWVNEGSRTMGIIEL